MSEGYRARETGQRAERIRRFIRSQFPLARHALANDDDPLLEAGIVDSLGILELVDFLTSEFDISVADDDLTPENFSSVRSLVTFVEGKLDRTEQRTRALDPGSS